MLEELLNIFTLWLTAKEQERVDMTSSNQKAMKERDQVQIFKNSLTRKRTLVVC